MTKKLYYLILFCFAVIIQAQNWEQNSKVVALHRQSSSSFGDKVAIDGDYAVVGAPADDLDLDGANSITDAGAAYVYKKEGSGWVLIQKLIAWDSRSYNQTFGHSVSIDGDYIVIGASSSWDANGGGDYISYAGAAYIFKRNGETWEQYQKIVASNRNTDDFGRCVDIDGDYIVVGAHLKTGDINGQNHLEKAGAGYIFKKEGDYWTQKQEFYDPHRAEGHMFGQYLAISGEYIIAGVSKENLDVDGANSLSNAGAVYLYKRNDESWTLQQKLVPPDRRASDSFGNAIDIDGDYIVVGSKSPSDADGENFLTNGGAAYVFKNNGGTWSQMQKIVSSDRADGDYFSLYTVSINGNLIVAGAQLEDEDANGANTLNMAGSAYVFKLHNGIWNQQQKIVPSSGRAVYDSFGMAVAIQGKNIIVGAYDREYTDTYNAGTAYIFQFNCSYLNIPQIEAPLVCSGNTTTLAANPQGNETFNWYDGENSTTPIFTGNEFTTPALTETTTYWIEAVDYPCTTARIEVTVTVNPIPPAPIAVNVGDFVIGQTLADLDVEAEGDLTWYADAALTIALPETTPLEAHTTYWVIQTLNGCTSTSTSIETGEVLSTQEASQRKFAYYPNPVKEKLYFKGNENVKNVQVFDISGKLVLEQSGTEMKSVDVKVLQKGSYILKVQTDKQIRTLKILKD